MQSKIEKFYAFDEFVLDTEAPTLWREGKTVSIFPKALEILVLLVRKHGEIVSRDELLETVWRDTFVEESNITYTISLLRKALGERAKGRLIQTLPKRGYRFTADVRPVAGPDPLRSERIKTPATPRKPVPWLFISIIFLGLFFVSSFALWWNMSAQRGLSAVPATERNIRHIAILPFRAINAGDDNRALTLGLADSLISRLGSLNRFAVRPLTSVKEYSEEGLVDPLQVGGILNVDAVLEGTIQSVDDRLRINVRLWDVRDGAQLWQDSFDETDADLFKLQDTISIRVTKSLVSELLDRDRELLAKRETENPEAFQAFWRGRYFIEMRDTGKAAAEFQKAIDLDPNYALAYTGLADALIWEASFTSDRDRELYSNAQAAVRLALKLDPGLADAHSSMGRIQYLYDWDWKGSEESFRRAIDLDPASFNARQHYARLLTIVGRYDEALAQIEKARELDPRSADLNVPLSGILEKQLRFDESIRVLEMTLDMDKDSKFALRGIANDYLLKGDYAKVIEMGKEFFQRAEDIDFAWASMLATAFFKTGQLNEAGKIRTRLKKMAETDPKSLYFLALSDSETGRIDEAVAALEECLDLREERMTWSKNEPRFAALESDPRFQEILRKMNLDDISTGN